MIGQEWTRQDGAGQKWTGQDRLNDLPAWMNLATSSSRVLPVSPMMRPGKSRLRMMLDASRPFCTQFHVMLCHVILCHVMSCRED